MEVCRLCLELLQEATFSKLTEPYKCIINNVVPEAELDITINPVICQSCSGSIDELHKFKLLCYDSQQKLLKGKKRGQPNLTAQQILYGSSKKNKDINYKICRTCLESIEREHFTALTPPSPDAYLEGMLTMCLPEVNLTICKEPVMCEKCFGSLQKLHYFKTSCLDIEQALKEHKLKKDPNSKDPIDLHVVLAERALKLTAEYSDVCVKEELVNEDDSEVNLISSEGSERVQIKEEIDVKMEEFLLQAGIGLMRRKQINNPQQAVDPSLSLSQLDQQSCSISCDICNKSFSTFWNMQRHKLNHTGEKRFECGYCHMRYSQKHIMEKHVRSRHTGERPYTCNQCTKTFTAKSNLNSHVKMHQGIKPYTCAICGHTFGQKSNLKKHILGHSEPVRMKEFQCEICFKLFTTKYNLQSHMEIHTGHKPYECDLCGETFRHTMNLRIHKLTHAGKNPYTCALCGMQFLHVSGLHYHEKTHSGDKPFECPICGKRFVRESIVASHMTLHTGDKQFECFICKNKYADKSKLNYHLKKKCMKGLEMSVTAR